MLASYDYPLLGVFWTMLWFFCFFIWIWLLIIVISDIFRSHDLSGWGKALWMIFVIILPLLGVLIYLIARGRSMQERAAKQAADSQAQFDDYVRQTASSTSTAGELANLAQLRDDGTLSADEYEKAKAKVLS